MSPTIKFDTSRFSRMVGDLHDALIGAGQFGDAANVIRDESRRLLQQVMKFTPPMREGRSPASSDHAQGRRAVARDIRRAMTPLDIDTIRDKGLRAIFKKGDNEAFKAFQQRSGKYRGWRIERFDPVGLHQKQRDRRGRILRDKKVIVLETHQHKRYVAQMQRRVGIMRSGWALPLLALGGKVAAWIKRHTKKPGVFINHLATPNTPSVVVGNVAFGIGQVRHAFSSALKTRAEAIRRRVRLILSGYARDVARGMRPRRQTAIAA